MCVCACVRVSVGGGGGPFFVKSAEKEKKERHNLLGYREENYYPPFFLKWVYARTPMGSGAAVRLRGGVWD